MLDGLPPYGNMYISIPQNGYTEYSEGVVVEFEKKDKTKWIGNFETGNSNLKFSSKLNNSEDIIIIAKGICYIINVEKTIPLKVFGFDYKEIYNYRNLFILIGEYSISIVESADKIFHFSDLCYDGIKNSQLIDDKLYGELYNFNPSVDNYLITNFLLNLENLEYSEVKKNDETKDWWKFWK